MKKYYTLVTNEDGAGWAPQFGDYDREVVEAEVEDSYDDIPRRYVKIIRTGDSQAEIDAAIAKLNA
jgi:hypothetical protein